MSCAFIRRALSDRSAPPSRPAICSDFDAEQFANAIGIAGSRCGGLFVNLGTMTKATHCAYAAALGLEAALLTRRGFTGCPTLFDPAPQSYGDAFFPRGFRGRRLCWISASPSASTIPATRSRSSRRNSPPIMRSPPRLAARPQIPSPDAIRSIRITAADVPSSDRPHPRSGLDGKFSLQYTTAVALLDGHVGLASFTDERLARADMQALLGKIEVTLSRDIPSLYTAGRYLDLEIELANGDNRPRRAASGRAAPGARRRSPTRSFARRRAIAWRPI